jgi:FAD:protein FMN transferase
MGMPVTVEIIAQGAKADNVIQKVFDYFIEVDKRFSTYKSNSEISRINKGLLKKENYSGQMKEVLQLSEEWKSKTDGYFDIKTPGGLLDPSGLVKGWAILNASRIIDQAGFKNYFVSAGDDIQIKGKNKNQKPWSVGIRHPVKKDKLVKVLHLTDRGIATSGNYIRGNHIYNPHSPKSANQIVSLTVIGPNIYLADIYATACFAMGKPGLIFLENLINSGAVATWTSGFDKYLA